MASKKSAVPSFELKIGGKAMDKAERLDVQEIVVDSLSDGPDMVQIKLNAHEGDERGLGVWLERKEIKIGNPIEASMSFYPETPKLVFKGEIIGWEPYVIGKEPAGVVVRGFNKLHRLSRGRRSRPWQEVALSDIATEIAGDWKLGTGGIKATSPVQPYVYQPGISDLDFLRLLASRVGYEVSADLQDNLIFAPPDLAQGASATLKWGENLKKFKSRLTAGQQISKVKVSSWNPKEKKRIEAVATASDVSSAMGGATKGPEAASRFEEGESEHHIRLPHAYSIEDLEAMAKGVMNQIALGYMLAECAAEGENEVMAGKIVDVDGMKSRFNGQYYVVRSQHILRPNQKLPDAGFVSHLQLRRTGAGD